RQEQCARGVGVEPADRHDSFRDVLDELDDRRAALRIAGGRYRSGRLVEQHVSQPLQGDLFPVDLDAVARVDVRVQLPWKVVDADAAGLDQVVRAAPGGDTRPCEIGVQAHRVIYSRHGPLRDPDALDDA